MKTSKRVALVSYFVLGLGAALVIFPFVWMMLSSFKPLSEIMAFPPTFFPQNFTLENYQEVWYKVNFSRFFLNSTVLLVAKTLIILYTSTLAGYVFTKLEFKWREGIFLAILSTMMVPAPVTILSLYQQMVWLNWVDSYKSIIITGVFNTFGIFVMRQFIASLPDSLMESARIDGAGEFTILHWIVLPLVKAALSALAIFIALSVWNDFLWPFLMLNSDSKYTVPVGLALFKGRYYTDYSKQITGAAITVLPMIALYLALQRQFVAGIMLTGMKE